jgi:hypothetical protein
MTTFTTGSLIETLSMSDIEHYYAEHYTLLSVNNTQCQAQVLLNAAFPHYYAECR